MLDQRAIRLLTHQPIPGDEQAPVGEERDAVAETGRRTVRDDFDVSVEIDSEDLVGPPVREPEAAVVPPGRLDHGETVEQDAGCYRHGRHTQ